MGKKTLYHSTQEAETGWNRAIQIKLNQGDDEGAQEIADIGLDAWLESTGRRIENPAPATLALINPFLKRSKTTMPRAKSVATLEAEIENLQNENLELQESLDLTEQALDEANQRISEIRDSAEPVSPEDFEEDSDEDDNEEESDEGNGEED